MQFFDAAETYMIQLLQNTGKEFEEALDKSKLEYKRVLIRTRTVLKRAILDPDCVTGFRHKLLYPVWVAKHAAIKSSEGAPLKKNYSAPYTRVS